MNTTKYKFDTISVMTNLKQSGLEEKPSVAIVDAISQAVENLVTTEELEAGLEKLKNELMQALQAMKAELLVRIDGVDVKHDKATTSLGSSLIQRVDGVESKLIQRVDGVESKLTQRVDGVESKLTQRVDGVESKLTQKIEDVRYELLQRIEKLEFMVEALQTDTESLKAKVELIAKEFVDLRAEMKNLTVEVNGLKKAMGDFMQDMTKNQEDFMQDMKKDQEGFRQEMLKMMENFKLDMENFKLDMEAKFARFQLMTMVTIISTGSSMAAILWGLTKLFGGN